MKTEKPPKRLRLKPRSYIDGVRFDADGQPRRLGPGLYVSGRNMTTEEATLLASPEFSHAVEILDDAPQPEQLAEDVEAPQPEAGDTYRQQKRREAEKARAELWNGSTK